MKRPILLLWMCSRSRSSLVAKIFHEHGIWSEHNHQSTVGGYTTYENRALKQSITR